MMDSLGCLIWHLWFVSPALGTVVSSGSRYSQQVAGKLQHHSITRCVGGPRQQWRHHTHKYIWNQYGGQGELEDSVEQIQSRRRLRAYGMLQHPWQKKNNSIYVGIAVMIRHVYLLNQEIPIPQCSLILRNSSDDSPTSQELDHGSFTTGISWDREESSW